jgi:1,2-diacylglycerol 3-beta-galactosyltransferase
MLPHVDALDGSTDEPEVLLLIVDAGGGHRSAANALLAAAGQARPSFRLRVESLQSILASLDPIRRLTGRSIEDVYNGLLRRRLTRHLVPLLRGMQWAIRLLHRPLTRRVARYLRSRPPHAVVSLAPNFNGVIRDAVRAACPGVPFLVLLTDLADFPPHFWLESGIDRVIVGSEKAVVQARQVGLPEAAIARSSGMVLHPTFSQANGSDLRARVRDELRIPDQAFTLLLLFGGKGTPEMAPLAQALLEGDSAWHLIAICGDNPRLLARMDSIKDGSAGRLHPIGFTSRVHELMAAADLLLAKPGPGTLSEAFQRRLPAVVSLDARTIPQERFNAQFVEQHGLGIVVGSWKEMPGVAKAVCSDATRLASLRDAVASLPANRAVWEALDFIGETLASALSGRHFVVTGSSRPTASLSS